MTGEETVGRSLQHAVIAAAAGVGHVHRAAKRLGPEPRGGVDIVGLAVDQNAIDAGAVHGDLPNVGLLRNSCL